MLDRDSIADLILGNQPLIESYLSLDQQLQPNGFDLTLREVARLTSPGSMGAASDQRTLSDTDKLEFDPALILPRALISSSVMPSEKYSKSASPLLLIKGITATEGISVWRRAGEACSITRVPWGPIATTP